MPEMQTSENHAIVHVNATSGEISPYLYGHFSEHLGHCIYGGYWVGPESPIPNTRGIRNDVVAALRQARVPVLRWPGGCFADEYHWQDGIGPADKRPTMINTHWGGVTENNHFGTHEFMDLCEQVGCEPYISGNVGSGTVQEMQQWVEYLTSDAVSPMTNLRRANGRAAPWPVRFWGVGNESWGCGGEMRAEYYADQYRRYATYCRNFGQNRLYKIASGANTADYHWTEVLMREAGQRMNGLSLHYYVVPGTWGAKGSATQFDEGEWFVTLKKALFMDELITQHSLIMDRYDPQKRVGLIVDEWGVWHDVEPGTPPGFLYQQNTLRDALVAGVTLNIFNQHCDRIYMANLAQTVNVLQAMLLVENDQLILTPTYHVFEMYAVHQGATWLPADLQCASWGLGDELIPWLSLSASRDAQGRMHLSICNLHPSAGNRLVCDLPGFRPGRVTGRVLTAGNISANNTAAHLDAVAPAPFEAVSVANQTLTLDLPARSVVVLEVAR